MKDFQGVSLQPECILDLSLNSLKTAARREIENSASPVERKQLENNPEGWRRGLLSLKADMEIEFQKRRMKSFSLGTAIARTEYERWKVSASARQKKIEDRIRELKATLRVPDSSKNNLSDIMLELLSEARAIRELLELVALKDTNS